ncbi:xylulokinase [Rouxiella silvae]|uniref:Xylulose kinase n=1 Tax=Rouxiella silvae TaxID=1646373 RepID=A0AA41BYB8_9GAMM|nr:xylulokinase [Rouxiella silvae]MBF6638864.1 xylulokinase [Rouxiella silvae]
MYLGLDLGTSEIKALVIDHQGKVLASAGEALEVQRPHPHWSEQHPAQWWQATQNVVTKLREKLPREWPEISAIGLSGQMHGAVLLGREGDVLRPAILWNDTRSAKECQQLTHSAPELHQITGNLAMPGFTAPKLLWVARFEPDIFSQIATVLLPKDYLRWKMSGDKVSDMSDAAGTLWLDVAKRDWSDTLLDACGLTRDQMPRLIEGSEASGYLNRDIARAWGLKNQVIIAGGGGDNAASAIGIGAVEPGDAFISLGTSGVLFAVNEKFSPNPQSAVHAFCHALPQRWHQMSVMLTAASALRWYCQLIGSNETTLLAEIAQLTQAEKRQAPLFLPYLSGERTPHNDPDAVGAFHGMTHSTQRASLGYAVLEGVAFGMADGLSVLKESGTELSRCSLVGGGARSNEWAQLIADVLNLTITTHQGGEAGGALGAARLGWLAVGGEVKEVCCKPEVKQTFLADSARHQVLQVRLATWRQLYQQQRELRR